jgi:hypothetical protein
MVANFGTAIKSFSNINSGSGLVFQIIGTYLHGVMIVFHRQNANWQMTFRSASPLMLKVFPA